MEIIRLYNIQNIGFTSIKQQLVWFNPNQCILFILSTLEPSANNFSKLLSLFLVRIKDVNMLRSKY